MKKSILLIGGLLINMLLSINVLASEAVEMKVGQEKIEAEIVASYNEDNHSLDNPFVIVDPYNIAPLSALVIFDTPIPSEITVHIKGKGVGNDVIHTFEGFKTHHELPIIGLYEDMNNAVTISVTDKNNKKSAALVEIKTEKLPEGAPEIREVKSDAKKMEEGFTFLKLMFSGQDKGFSAVDNNGDIRWYYSSAAHAILYRLENGNLLVNGSEDAEHGKQRLYEIDMLGKLYKSWFIPNGVHHDAIQLPTGNILVTSNSDDQYHIEDMLLELDYQTGEIVGRLDFKQVLSEKIVNSVPEGNSYLGKRTLDWLHNNGVIYDEADHSVITSHRNQSIVMKTTYPEGEIKWILAQNKNFPAEIEKKLLRSSDASFKFPTGQHSPMILPDMDNNPDTMDLVLFDNNFVTHSGIRGDEAEHEKYSNAVHYRIDEKNLLIEEIWNYGKELGKEGFSYRMGDIDYLQSTGNLLITFSDVSKELTGYNGKIIEINPINNEIVYELEIINSIVYRTFRDSIYPLNWNYGLKTVEAKLFNEKIQDEQQIDSNADLLISKEVDGYSIDVLDIREVNGLDTQQQQRQYDGSINVVEYSNHPVAGNKYIIANVRVTKTDTMAAPFQLNDISLDFGGVSYKRIDDSFLSKHNYKRLPSYELPYGSKEGFICFEIPKTVDIGEYVQDAVDLTITSEEVSINDTGVMLQNPTIYKEGYTYFAMTDLAAIFKVDLERSANEITLKDGTNVFVHELDSDFITQKGTNNLYRAAPSFEQDGQVYLPLRLITEPLDVFVSWTAPSTIKMKYAHLYEKTHLEIDEGILNTFSNGDYSLKEPLIIQNPYELSPLTAMILFHADEAVKVEVTIKGKDVNADINHKFETLKTSHAIPIYGLYADWNNIIEIKATNASGQASIQQVNIKTDALPNDASQAVIAAKKPEAMANGLTFFDCPAANANYEFAIDLNGDVRWYLTDKTLNGSVMMTHMQNGNIIVSSGKVIPNTYNNLSSVYEFTPLGRFVKEYSVYGIHHDIREKSNGDLIFAASKEGRESQNDYIVEVSRATGEVLRTWDLLEIIPMTTYETPAPYSGNLSNWIHNNSICYLETEDAFVISGRHQNTLMKFDAKTNEIKWIFSDTIGKMNEEVRKYLLLPIGANFEYPVSQHAVTILPNGDMMLFDNRTDYEKPEDGIPPQDKIYSRAVIYEIDEQAMTIKEVWQHGKEMGADLYSSYISDVDVLGENHYLIDFGGIYRDADGNSLDHIYTPAVMRNQSSRVTTVVEILNDEIIWRADLMGNNNSNTYKAERKDIYLNAVELFN